MQHAIAGTDTVSFRLYATRMLLACCVASLLSTGQTNVINFRRNPHPTLGSPPAELWMTLGYRGADDSLASAAVDQSLPHIRNGRLSPRNGEQQSTFDGEIITYVRSGTLAYEDCLGDIGLIRAGEFSMTSARQGTSYTMTNPSTSDWASVYQISLRSSDDMNNTRHAQKRFSAAERRGALRLVASGDGRNGSLRIRQDGFLFSAELSKGNHVVHALAPGRCAWLHVIEGSLKVGSIVMTAGDTLETFDEISVSATAVVESELLLLDLIVPATVANGV